KLLKNHNKVESFKTEMKRCRIKREDIEKFCMERDERFMERDKRLRIEKQKVKKENIAKILDSKPILRQPNDSITLFKLKKKGIKFKHGYLDLKKLDVK